MDFNNQKTKNHPNFPMAISGTSHIIVAAGQGYVLLQQRETKELSFSMAIGNEELVY